MNDQKDILDLLTAAEQAVESAQQAVDAIPVIDSKKSTDLYKQLEALKNRHDAAKLALGNRKIEFLSALCFCLDAIKVGVRCLAEIEIDDQVFYRSGTVWQWRLSRQPLQLMPISEIGNFDCYKSLCETAIHLINAWIAEVSENKVKDQAKKLAELHKLLEPLCAVVGQSPAS